MAVTKKDVEYVAELARLEFSEDEISKFTGDLNVILEYVNKLNELDTENVRPLQNPLPIENAFRDDDIRQSLKRDDVLMNAPESQGGYFKVPKVIE